MVQIGNFFFKYRNIIFIFFYAILFLPAPQLFTEKKFGPNYFYIPILLGLTITLLGQIIRGLTIGLAYIQRGGKDGKPYADGLQTEGIFRHCRNPLYVGNILMLLGMGILSNSVYFSCIMFPLFLFIYQAIVLAEENFLRGKFGSGYHEYCKDVNRWLPNLKGIAATFSSMQFNWKRWILKEYTTQFIWLSAITAILLLNYPQLTNGNIQKRNILGITIIAFLFLLYLLVRWMKKSRRLTA